MRIAHDIRTTIQGSAIVSEVFERGAWLSSEAQKAARALSRQVIDTQDRGVREALLKLGWRPPVGRRHLPLHPLADAANPWKLSSSEIVCLEAWGRGAAYKVIARDIGISHRSVQTYLYHVRRKMGTGHKTDHAAERWREFALQAAQPKSSATTLKESS